MSSLSAAGSDVCKKAPCLKKEEGNRSLPWTSSSGPYNFRKVCAVCGERSRLVCRVCHDESYCSKECKEFAFEKLEHRKACGRGSLHDLVKAAVGRWRASELARAVQPPAETTCDLCKQVGSPYLPLYWSGCPCGYYAHARCLVSRGDCPRCEGFFTGAAGAVVKFDAWFDDDKQVSMDWQLAKCLANAEQPVALRVARLYYEKCLGELGEAHAEVGHSIEMIAESALLLRHTAEAVRAYRALLEWREANYGPADRATFDLRGRVGIVFLVVAQWQESEDKLVALARESARLFREQLKSKVPALDHLALFPNLIGLIRALALAGDLDDARRLLDAYRDRVPQVFGPNHGFSIRFDSLDRAYSSSENPKPRHFFDAPEEETPPSPPSPPSRTTTTPFWSDKAERAHMEALRNATAIYGDAKTPKAAAVPGHPGRGPWLDEPLLIRRAARPPPPDDASSVDTFDDEQTPDDILQDIILDSGAHVPGPHQPSTSSGPALTSSRRAKHAAPPHHHQHHPAGETPPAAR